MFSSTQNLRCHNHMKRLFIENALKVWFFLPQISRLLLSGSGRTSFAIAFRHVPLKLRQTFDIRLGAVLEWFRVFRSIKILYSTDPITTPPPRNGDSIPLRKCISPHTTTKMNMLVNHSQQYLHHPSQNQLGDPLTPFDQSRRMWRRSALPQSSTTPSP